MDNLVIATITRASGSQESSAFHNLRTNDGLNWMADRLGSASQLSAIRNIALTEDTTTPTSSMTNLAGELAADGLSRKTATYAHTANASRYTQSATWQYTGSSTVTIARAAMVFGATDGNDSADTHFLITAVSPLAVLNSSDTFELAWGVGL